MVLGDSAGSVGFTVLLGNVGFGYCTGSVGFTGVLGGAGTQHCWVMEVLDIASATG